jgi:hypothetical protein
MNSVLYLFVNKNKTEFKIGITDDIEERYLRLTSVWGDIDIKYSCMLIGDRKEVVGLEKTLHFLLDRWRVEKPKKLDGHKEWFSIECFDKAIEVIGSAAMLRNFSLDDKLIHGISIANHRNREKNTRIKPHVQVVADFEGIKSKWPYYKKGTIDFIDHPKVKDTWLWAVDIGDTSIHSFMDLFRFQNSRSAIRLISEAHHCIDNPSIVDASVSKHALSWLNEYETYKKCYDFIFSEINLLITEHLHKPGSGVIQRRHAAYQVQPFR